MSTYAKIESDDSGDDGWSTIATIVSTEHLLSREHDRVTEFALLVSASTWFDGVAVRVVDRAGTDDELEVELLRLTDKQVAKLIAEQRGS